MKDYQLGWPWAYAPSPYLSLPLSLFLAAHHTDKDNHRARGELARGDCAIAWRCFVVVQSAFFFCPYSAMGRWVKKNVHPLALFVAN